MPSQDRPASFAATLARLSARLTGAAVAALALNLAAAAPATARELPQLDLPALQGKVVLLDFWASWCGPCKESFPWMDQLQARYRDRGLVVIAVNVDHDRVLADRFLHQQSADLSVVFDPKGSIAEQFKVEAMPTSFYIDRQGHVRHTHAGFHLADRDAAEKELLALLEQH